MFKQNSVDPLIQFQVSFYRSDQLTTRELETYLDIIIILKIICTQKMCQNPCWYIFANRPFVIISVFGFYFEGELIVISNHLFLKGLEENLTQIWNSISLSHENYNILNKINMEVENQEYNSGIYYGSLLIFEING